MKIIMEDCDRNYIERINESLETDTPIPVFCGEKKGYSFSFDVVDIAKANAFVSYLMSPNKNKEIEDLLGIRISSINLSKGDAKLNELKSKLQDFMQKLDAM